jgi:cytochrome P450
MDELNTLTFLDHVLKETLRLYNPVPNTVREAMEDDIIPVSKPFTDIHGQVHDSIRLRKGDTVLIPILAINSLQSLWGEDANEFRPDRWSDLPHAVNEIPGLLNTLSFLGGPRACIGYRFSLVETKAILFTLIRAFEFELAVPAQDVVRTMTSVVQRPSLKTDPNVGSQLPLLMKPFFQDELDA